MAPLFNVVVVPKGTRIYCEPRWLTKWHAAQERKQERKLERKTLRSRLKRTSKLLFPHLHHNDLTTSAPNKRRPRPTKERPTNSHLPLDSTVPDSRYHDRIYASHGENLERRRWKAEAEKYRLEKARIAAGARKPGQPSDTTREGRRVHQASTDHARTKREGKDRSSIPVEWIPAPRKEELERLDGHRKAWSHKHRTPKSNTKVDKKLTDARPKLIKNPRWTISFKGFPYRLSTHQNDDPAKSRKSFRQSTFGQSLTKRTTSFRELRWNGPLPAPPPKSGKSGRSGSPPPPVPTGSVIRDSRYSASCDVLPSPILPRIARKTVSSDDLQPPGKFSEEGVGLGVSYGKAHRGPWSPGRRITLTNQYGTPEHSRAMHSKLEKLVEDVEQPGYFVGAKPGQDSAVQTEMPVRGRHRSARRSRSAGELGLEGMEQTVSPQGPRSDLGHTSRQIRGRSRLASDRSVATERSRGPRRHEQRPSKARGFPTSGQTADHSQVVRVTAPNANAHPLSRNLIDAKQTARAPAPANPESEATVINIHARRTSSVYSQDADDESALPAKKTRHNRNTVRFADDSAARKSKRKSSGVHNLSISDFLKEVEQSQRDHGARTGSTSANERYGRTARAADALARQRSKRRSAILRDRQAQPYKNEVDQSRKFSETRDQNFRPGGLRDPASREAVHRLIEAQRLKKQRREQLGPATDETSDIVQPLRVFTSNQPARMPAPPGYAVIGTKRPGVDTSIHPALRVEKPLPTPIPQHPATVEVKPMPPSLAHHVLRSTVSPTGRRPSKVSTRFSDIASSHHASMRDSRLQHYSVPKAEQLAILRGINRARGEARTSNLALEAKMSLRAQTYADMDLPPLTPAKETASNRARPTHTSVVHPITPFSEGLPDINTTRLISPPRLSAFACAQLWAMGKTKRHKTISTTLSPSTHRYTKFPMAGRISAFIGSAPPTPEPEEEEAPVCKAGGCGCKEYDAWATVTDERWRGVGIGRAADGRWVVDLVEMPGVAEGGRF